MSWQFDTGGRPNSVTIPTFWVALVLSILLHAAVMWQWLPKIRFPTINEPERAAASGSMVVHLAPPHVPQPSTPPLSMPAQPAPRAPPAAPRVAAQKPPAAPVIALNRPTPDTPSPAPAVPPVSAPAPVRPPTASDLLASFRESQRNSRNAPQDATPRSPPADDDRTRSNRVAAANVASQRIVTFGYDPNRSGGVFKIQRTGLNDAEFMFYGWNPDARRNTAQLIEVKRENHSDIRVAVVRKMIAIIRDNVQEEDFLWDSKRLGRSMTLSARVRDNAGLEDFLLREFEF